MHGRGRAHDGSRERPEILVLVGHLPERGVTAVVVNQHGFDLGDRSVCAPEHVEQRFLLFELPVVFEDPVSKNCVASSGEHESIRWHLSLSATAWRYIASFNGITSLHPEACAVASGRLRRIHS
jgi:hypothetical protein